jgi:hypothetical protein
VVLVSAAGRRRVDVFWGVCSRCVGAVGFRYIEVFPFTVKELEDEIRLLGGTVLSLGVGGGGFGVDRGAPDGCAR